MSSCEKCWWDAHRLVRDGIEPDIATAYHKLLKERDNNPCTPEEQAGQFWDEDKQIDTRLLKGKGKEDFVEELGNNGEIIPNYPDEDPLEEDRNYGR